MSKFVEKKANYKPKGDALKSRFGFEYNPEYINYRTEIPAIPQKPRHKPEEKHRDKKIADVNQKIKTLKQERKIKKDSIKKLKELFDGSAGQITDKMSLGRQCTKVLEFDLAILSDEIYDLNGKIYKIENNVRRLQDELSKLNYQNKPTRKTNKPHEQMTIDELNQQIYQIELQMSKGQLSKKEQAEFNIKLNKLQKIKLDKNRKIVEPTKQKNDNTDKIKYCEEKLNKQKIILGKLKTEKKKVIDDKHQIEDKISDIKLDIQEFYEELNQITEKQNQNQDIRLALEQSKKIKQSIYQLREEITKIEKQFEDKMHEYDYEQEKIKWINWATSIQDIKRQQWEDEKAERKRQKLREKGVTQKTEKKEQTKEGEKKIGEGQVKKVQERKRINRNQKQIDNCAFLIDYCKGLNPENSTSSTLERKQVNIQAELKKGQWAKEKNIQIIQSKKSKKDEELTPKNFNRKQAKEQEEIVPVNRFSHTFFVANSFDAVKVLPPNNAEELAKAIKELEDKLEYYLSHPNEGVERNFAQDKKYVDRTVTQQDSKYTKSKGSKKVINTQDFPSLA